MGSFPSIENHQLAYLYARDSVDAAYLYVIDLDSSKVIAWMFPPAGYIISLTYFDFVTDPEGRKYLFLAPGAHYLNGDSYAGTKPPAWDFLCQFDPNAIAHPDRNCATGFRSVPISFLTEDGRTPLQASGFRHNGGWTTDVDGDRWGDINIPYLFYVVTVSGRTGEPLGLSRIEPAAPVQTASNAGFDSGRLYGTYTVFIDPLSGQSRTLLAGGDGVGTFKDPFCNVSRFNLVTAWNGHSWQVVWDQYFTFAKTTFILQNNLVNSYTYLGHDLDGCTHHYGDSLARIGGVPTVVFNYFRQLNPAPICQEQLLREQISHQADTSYKDQCTIEGGPILSELGRWSLRFQNASTGAGLNEIANTYVWGEAANVWPGAQDTVLVQKFNSSSGQVAFEKTAARIDQFQIAKYTEAYGLKLVASLNNPSAPPEISEMVNFYGAYGPGLGSSNSNSGVRHLILKDIDGDGLNDIRLTNDHWLGYSKSTHGLAEKFPAGS